MTNFQVGLPESPESDTVEIRFNHSAMRGETEVCEYFPHEPRNTEFSIVRNGEKVFRCRIYDVRDLLKQAKQDPLENCTPRVLIEALKEHGRCRADPVAGEMLSFLLEIIARQEDILRRAGKDPCSIFFRLPGKTFPPEEYLSRLAHSASQR